MPTFLQTLMDAIAVGSLYALIALGYTLVFGILQFINFAHSDVFALGAWITCVSAVGLIHYGQGHPGFGNPWILCVLVPIAAIGVCGVVGFLIQNFAYKPLRHAPRLNVLITAIGVSLLLENVGQQRGVFGPYPRAVPTIFPDRVLAHFAGVDLRLVNVLVFGIAIGLMLVMQYWIYHTRFGRAMRAISYNINIAALMGINVDRVIALTFVIGSCLAGAAGFLYAMKYPQLQQTAAPTWILLGLKAFVAAVVGGIGNVRGALLGGILIGLIEFFGVAYLWSDYRDVYVFVVLILVLLIRPQGILGTSAIEKV